MEAAEYDRMDAAEDTMWWFRAAHQRVEEALSGLTPGSARILDAGCGTGGLLARLRRRFPGLFLAGIDIDAKAGRRAAAKSGAPVAAASVNALPFAAESFDAVLSVDVLCHGGVDQEAALRDARRCLKAGGIVVINLPAFRWMMSDHDHRVHNVRRYSRAEVRDLLSKTGFRLQSLVYWNSLLFPLMVLRRKVFRSREGESDVQDYPAAVNRLFGAVLGAERKLSGLGLRLPFGGSILAVAVKADD